MIISYNWLNSFFKEKLPSPEKLADLITKHAFEVEKPFKQNDDYIMEIDVLPDRGGDAACHFGIAKEIAMILDYKLEDLKDKTKEDFSNNINDYLSVQIKDSAACPRYIARVLTNIKVQESPDFIKQRLKACGISPINNIVDITNYVMLELGQPMHAYDYEKLGEDKQIIVDFAKAKQEVSLLGGNQIEVTEKTLLIKDKKEPLGIAGIKGGERAEITNHTKAIVLESALFNSTLISKTSRAIKLKTDASFKFEHEIDEELPFKAMKRATSLFQELYGAKVLKGIIDFYPKKNTLNKIRLDLPYLKKLLGIDIPKNEIKKILKKLDFIIEKQDLDYFILQIPSSRKDIKIQESIIEEIGRIYGYDKIMPAPHIGAFQFNKNLNIYWQNIFKQNLKELGLTEVYNYSFISKEEKQNFDLKNLIEIENPLNVNSEFLKNSLIPLLANNLKLNSKYFKEIDIFEIGKIFKKEQEELKLGLASYNQNYLSVKSIVEEALNNASITDIKYIPNNKGNSFWHKNKSAIIQVNQENVGIIGHLSSFVLHNLKFKKDPIFCELDFNLIQKHASEVNEYRPISNHPAAVRDLSVIIPFKEASNLVLEEIYNASELITEVELFDTYEDNYKKSLSFHIIFQSQKRALENQELNELQNKIINNLEKHPAWEVKKQNI